MELDILDDKKRQIDAYIVNIRYKCYEAIDLGHLDKVKKLWNILTSSRDTERNYHLLISASTGGPFEIFEYLTSEIDVNYEYKDGKATLWMDIMHNSNISNKILYMLSLIENINHKDIHGSTILHIIVGSYDRCFINKTCMEKVKLLLENGANPYIEDRRGYSVIDLALCSKDSIKLLNLLLKEYVGIRTIHNAILFTVKEYMYDVVELLLKYIKNINESLPNGHSILWHAKKNPQNVDIVELLEMNGACL